MSCAWLARGPTLYKLRAPKPDEPKRYVYSRLRSALSDVVTAGDALGGDLLPAWVVSDFASETKPDHVFSISDVCSAMPVHISAAVKDPRAFCSVVLKALCAQPDDGSKPVLHAVPAPIRGKGRGGSNASCTRTPRRLQRRRRSLSG